MITQTNPRSPREGTIEAMNHFRLSVAAARVHSEMLCCAWEGCLLLVWGLWCLLSLYRPTSEVGHPARTPLGSLVSNVHVLLRAERIR